MTQFRCYYLTLDRRLAGGPAEISAPDARAALVMAAGLYGQRAADLRFGMEIWDGRRRVFLGDPCRACAGWPAAAGSG